MPPRSRSKPVHKPKSFRRSSRPKPKPAAKPKRHRHLNEGVPATNEVSAMLGAAYTKPKRSHHKKPSLELVEVAVKTADATANVPFDPSASEAAREDAVSSASVSLNQELEQTLHAWYRQLARYLAGKSFEDLEGSDLKKAEMARAAIEGRLAGTASTSDFLSEFFQELADEEKQAERQQGAIRARAKKKHRIGKERT